MKPILLLDIDGVVSPFSQPEDSHIEAIVDGELLFVRTKVIEFIHSFNSIFDVRWASLREQDSLVFAKSFNLPEFDFISFDRISASNKTMKLETISNFVDSIERHVIWVDDELYDDADNWVSTIRNKVLLVSCNSDIGLTDNDYEQIIRFSEAIL